MADGELGIAATNVSEWPNHLGAPYYDYESHVQASNL